MHVYWKVCLTNGAVFLVGTLALALTPVRVSEVLLLEEAFVLLFGMTVIFSVNALLLRFSLVPVDAVIEQMDELRLHETAERLPDVPGTAGKLVRAYNSMVDRLRAERAASAVRALAAQEAERQRVAQELHDEVGQSLTAVLLGLKRLRSLAPEIGDDIDIVREAATASLDDIRRVVRQLRPDALEHLGLAEAIAELCREAESVGGAVIERRIDPDLPPLPNTSEIVIYRVAQEALTNVLRHAGASKVLVRLAVAHDDVVLTVEDDGRGCARVEPGTGVLGMRERAAHVGGLFDIVSHRGDGTVVTLAVPFGGEG